jgi:cellulose synthase/poly-beta-1,6-N-acetylglucosamine synthase-like glycosyltransferase
MLVLDCDHVPTKNKLQQTAGYFLADPKLFLVQTPQKLLSLLQQGRISQTINLSIRENDAAMLIYLAELYPDVFTCARIDWA